MKIINFFKNFPSYIPDRSNKIVDNNILGDLIKSILEESSPRSVKPGEVIDEYTVRNIVKIIISKHANNYEYIVVEPLLNPQVINAVINIYLENPSCESQYCIGKTIEEIGDPELYEIYSRYPLEITYHYLKVSSGYGALYPLIIDQKIEEIAGAADDRYVSIIHRDYAWYGWMDTNIELTPREIDRIVLSLARRAGKHLSLAYPVAEGLTPEGIRVSLTFGREVSRKGSSFVLRKKPPRIITITELINNQTLSPLIAAYLWLILELKGFILIIGGMSSGKTTLLQALLTLIPPSRRVVTIEDTPEIMGSTGKWDPLIERPTVSKSEQGIDMYDLLKFSLRRRADYIVVGEVRGKEARLLVQASRLGHGILATMHGENAKSVLERLMAPPISIPKKLLSNIWVIVQMENVKGKRYIKKIYEVNDNVEFKELVDTSNPMQLVEASTRLSQILDPELLVQELVSRTMFLQKLVDKGMYSYDVLAEELLKYYIGEEDIVERSDE